MQRQECLMQNVCYIRSALCKSLPLCNSWQQVRTWQIYLPATQPAHRCRDTDAAHIRYLYVWAHVKGWQQGWITFRIAPLCTLPGWEGKHLVGWVLDGNDRAHMDRVTSNIHLKIHLLGMWEFPPPLSFPPTHTKIFVISVWYKYQTSDAILHKWKRCEKKYKSLAKLTGSNVNLECSQYYCTMMGTSWSFWTIGMMGFHAQRVTLFIWCKDSAFSPQSYLEHGAIP